MAIAESTGLLRAGLLQDVSLLLAGAPASAAASARSAPARTVAEVCAGLGARIAHCRPISDRSEPVAEVELDAEVASAVAQAGRIDLLAVDGAALFDCGMQCGGDGHAALRACMDGAWNATRATVNHAFLQAPESGGRVVYLAPAIAAGEHAPAACAGLENLARTLSTEWARYQITTVTIAPGVATTVEEIAALIAYLASPAGAYFSGCLLDLRGARRA
jgi:NAD(P)-dependent dehydrogenase (short-subunit alcohol dehydrogenase family)